MISSGSSGNMIILNGENEALILDCGMPYKMAMKALDYDVSKIAGVCVTHSHS